MPNNWLDPEEWMKFLPRLCLLVLASGVWPLPAVAADQPSEVAAAYFKAMSKGDWQATASLMHPEALRKFKDMMSAAAKGRDGKEMLQQLFQVPGAKEFEALSAGEVFRRFWVSLARMQPEMVDLLASTKQEILGAVADGKDVIHLVSKVTIRPEPGVVVSQTDLVSLQKDGESWRILLTGDIEGMAERLAGQ